MRFKYCIINIYRRSVHQNAFNEQLAKIRNIALLAHIDAGKTTTTERMLYYSGKISQMGEVDLGNTVTDFMELERAKGITISSACVTLPWNKHIINLVDTPGHIDFTMEVEQALKVIDSAVILLDASAGVEAQTYTVYQQLHRKSLPALFYVNKMDRQDADFKNCISTIESKLIAKALPVHIPVKGKDMLGHINLARMEQTVWRLNSGMVERTQLNESNQSYIDAFNARIDLVDSVSSLDDHLANSILEKGSLELIDDFELISALRRVTAARKACPVICGSSYKNVGIETLLDSIVDYLPSPLESSETHLSAIQPNHLLARCYKIVHDKQRGAVSLFRIYSGRLVKSQKVYNICQDKTEQIGRILRIFADDLQEIPSATSGHFVAATGLKEIVSGDLICDTGNQLKHLQKKLAAKFKVSEALVFKELQTANTIPEPVFFCSIEPESQRWQAELDKALKELRKEDPSLRIDFDADTGQTVLAGMGELHLEIVKEKLMSNYGIRADIGPIQIAYKEQLIAPSKQTFLLKNNAGGEDYSITITLSLEKGYHEDMLCVERSSDAAQHLARITPIELAAVKTGLIAALKHGPLYSSPVVNVHGILHWLELKKFTPEPLLICAAAQCVTKILQQSGTGLLEPFMSLNITVGERHVKSVLMDLSKRRAIILNVDNVSKIKEIQCEVPLSELLGYAKYLRTLTSGTAMFAMQFASYRAMSLHDQTAILNKHMCN